MITEKIITICETEVRMRFCAATETNYEFLSGKSIAVFFPTATKEKDENGKPILEAAKATQDDYIRLAFGAILAAYEVNDQDPPVTVKQIMHEAVHDEIENMKSTVMDMMLDWYKIPRTVPQSEYAEEMKAAETPNA